MMNATYVNDVAPGGASPTAAHLASGAHSHNLARSKADGANLYARGRAGNDYDTLLCWDERRVRCLLREVELKNRKYLANLGKKLAPAVRRCTR